MAGQPSVQSEPAQRSAQSTATANPPAARAPLRTLLCARSSLPHEPQANPLCIRRSYRSAVLLSPLGQRLSSLDGTDAVPPTADEAEADDDFNEAAADDAAPEEMEEGTAAAAAAAVAAAEGMVTMQLTIERLEGVSWREERVSSRAS